LTSQKKMTRDCLCANLHVKELKALRRGVK
jgi:hypothetical protein